MKWSYRVGEWFGIGVYVHLTFGLLLGWIALSTLVGTSSLAAALVSVAFVLALFGFVVLHEYGHALTARHFGVRTRDITLYPIGGVAALERLPDSPRQQALIAIAGPAVNFALAGILAGFSWLIGIDPFGSGPSAGALSELLGVMVEANLVVGVFNLLPALPMDGGRLFTALLSTRMDAQRATAIAARVARFVAVGMALYGLFADPARPLLVVIAAFVWLTAGVEARYAARRAHASRFNAWPTDRYRAGGAANAPDGYVEARPTDRYRAAGAVDAPEDYVEAWPTDRHRAAGAVAVPEGYVEAWPTPRHPRGSARASRPLRFVVVRGRFGPVLRVVVDGQ